MFQRGRTLLQLFNQSHIFTNGRIHPRAISRPNRFISHFVISKQHFKQFFNTRLVGLCWIPFHFCMLFCILKRLRRCSAEGAVQMHVNWLTDWSVDDRSVWFSWQKVKQTHVGFVGFIDFIVDPCFQVMGDMLEAIVRPLQESKDDQSHNARGVNAPSNMAAAADNRSSRSSSLSSHSHYSARSTPSPVHPTRKRKLSLLSLAIPPWLRDGFICWRGRNGEFCVTEKKLLFVRLLATGCYKRWLLTITSFHFTISRENINEQRQRKISEHETPANNEEQHNWIQ